MRILIVDDEAQIRSVCERAFRQAGYEASTAESGQAALPRLGESWDVILTDLTMPGTVNGTELLRQARELSSADLILMTANPGLNTAIEALQAGAYDYLIKPFSIDDLLLTVKRCLDKRQLSRELSREKALRLELQEAHAELTRLSQVQKTFGQFVTPEVVQMALAHPENFWELGARRDVTVLFADVRRFTPFAGGYPPELVVATLNEIFSRVVGPVQRRGGILNKFMGDGILALFGAPLDMQDHARTAALAALEARDAVEEWSRSRKWAGLPPLRIGIGIDSGEVVAGCLGTESRTEYGVIGHTVNLASRLESAAAPGQILLGPGTDKRLDAAFQRRRAGSLKLKGIAEPVPVLELVACSDQRLPTGRI